MPGIGQLLGAGAGTALGGPIGTAGGGAIGGFIDNLANGLDTNQLAEQLDMTDLCNQEYARFLSSTATGQQVISGAVSVWNPSETGVYQFRGGPWLTEMQKAQAMTPAGADWQAIARAGSWSAGRWSGPEMVVDSNGNRVDTKKGKAGPSYTGFKEWVRTKWLTGGPWVQAALVGGGLLALFALFKLVKWVWFKLRGSRRSKRSY